MGLLQEEIIKHLDERGWGKSPPGDYAKSISIESAELLEHFQWDNPTDDEVKKDPQKLTEIRYEIADVAIYSIELCIKLGIDFEKAILEKLAIAQKKYPVEAVLNNRDSFLKIHKDYRKTKK